MKKFAILLVLSLIVGMLAGCAGTPVVYYSDCTCPTGAHADAQTPAVDDKPVDNTPADNTPAAEGAVKTGLYLSAAVDAEQKYDATMVAVLVDDEGVILDCVIDGVSENLTADAVPGAIRTKNEKGPDYGMVAWGGAVAEWDEQAAALADFAVGKTVEELKSGAIDETGKAPAGSDLASSATIYLGGYVAGIEAAVANAKHLGAQAGDELKLAANGSINEELGLDLDVVALTVNGETITSCVIDAVQAKAPYDGGVSFQTKNELGESYGMVAWGGAIAEWNDQAAAFAAYVTGKTAAEVAGIAVDEGTKPTETDLVNSVTIAIGGFQALIAKACQ